MLNNLYKNLRLGRFCCQFWSVWLRKWIQADKKEITSLQGNKRSTNLWYFNFQSILICLERFFAWDLIWDSKLWHMRFKTLRKPIWDSRHRFGLRVAHHWFIQGWVASVIDDWQFKWGVFWHTKTKLPT